MKINKMDALWLETLMGTGHLGDQVTDAPLGWHWKCVSFTQNICLLYRYMQCTVNQVDMGCIAG